jgi:hypothetical protein
MSDVLQGNKADRNHWNQQNQTRFQRGLGRKGCVTVRSRSRTQNYHHQHHGDGHDKSRVADGDEAESEQHQCENRRGQIQLSLVQKEQHVQQEHRLQDSLRVVEHPPVSIELEAGVRAHQ